MQPAGRAPRLVLSMICGNEERVIARCLEAALPHVDGFVICVNGNDGTEKIIKRVTKKFGKPGIVVRHAWRSFGHNRTLAANAAREWSTKQGWPSASTYLLLLDADMILHVDKKPVLVEPCYEIRQYIGQSHHANPRLLRLSHDWKCLRRTHEYWSATPDTGGAALDGIWIEDRNDGGSKSDKYERDAKLLREDLEEFGQNDARALFYLAETYFHWAQWTEEKGDKSEALSRFSAAEELYERRTQAGGWYEERWFAAYKRGLAALNRERLARDLGVQSSGFRSGEALLLEAHEQRPSRAEPLAALATHYRTSGKNHLAVMCAQAAKKIPPSNDRLFVNAAAWTIDPDRDLSIAAYYTPDRSEGLAACERLLARRGLSQQLYDETGRNETFYMQPLPGVLQRGTFDVSSLLIGPLSGFVGTNPTIVHSPDHQMWFDVHVRLVNYTQKGGRYYTAPGDIFQTHGAALTMSRLDGSTSKPALVSEPKRPKGWNPDARIRGLEDKRLVEHNGSVYFTATCCETPDAGGWPRVVLGKMSNGLGAVDRVVTLGYGQTGEGAREKNWIPWSAGKLRLIYSYDPFIVLEVNPNTGSCKELRRWEPPFHARRWKGSTPPVPFGIVRTPQGDETDRTELMLVHETAYMLKDGQWEYSIYSHRFVEVTLSGLTIRRYSNPFFFDHSGVEYATGLARTQSDTFIITYGFEDREARWVEVSREQIESMLSVDR